MIKRALNRHVLSIALTIILSATSGRNMHSRGNWIAFKVDASGNPFYSNPRRLVAWRLRDGDWNQDIALGP